MERHRHAWKKKDMASRCLYLRLIWWIGLGMLIPMHLEQPGPVLPGGCGPFDTRFDNPTAVRLDIQRQGGCSIQKIHLYQYSERCQIDPESRCSMRSLYHLPNTNHGDRASSSIKGDDVPCLSTSHPLQQAPRIRTNKLLPSYHTPFFLLLIFLPNPFLLNN